MVFNMNAQAKVKLTAYGARFYGWWLIEIGRPVLDSEIKGAGDELTMPLWEIMQIFGGKWLFMGMQEVPFVDNKIDIEGAK